jgi:acyl carrier protein
MSAPPDRHIEAARSLVARALERPLESIPTDGSLETISAWDSLGHVRILLEIEAETGRMLDSEMIATMRSVIDVARALASDARL